MGACGSGSANEGWHQAPETNLHGWAISMPAILPGAFCVGMLFVRSVGRLDLCTGTRQLQTWGRGFICRVPGSHYLQGHKAC
jgi:hypothetical protein